MPRAVDPSLFGQQLPLTHDPLSRIDYRFRKPDGFTIDQLLEGARTFVIDYLFPTIEELTGIDLSVFLPLLDLLDLDFSSPAAFLLSLVNAILALPAVVAQLLVGLINELENLPETLTQLLSALIEMLISLPAMLQQLTTGLVPWFDIEGIDFLNGALDGINLEPGGVLRMIRQLIGDGLEDVPLLGEVIQPLTGLMGNVSDLERRFQNLFDAFTLNGGELDLPLDDFNPLTVIDRLIDDRIKPLEKLAELVGGLLPDSQKPQWLQDVTDNIHNAYANLGDPLDIDLSAPSVLDAILGVFTTGLNASGQVSALNARVRALETTAGMINIDFSGSSSSSLNGDWDKEFGGGGGGQIGLDGSGNAVWKSSGSSTRIEIARYIPSALTTDNGVIETILATTPQSFVYAGAATYIGFRLNTTNDTYTRLQIGYDWVRMQSVIAEAITNIGPSISVSPKAGDRFRVVFGEAAGANPRHFVVTRNGSSILDFTAAIADAVVGASNLHIGIAMETGNRNVFFQNIPAGLAVLTASEVM